MNPPQGRSSSAPQSLTYTPIADQALLVGFPDGLTERLEAVQQLDRRVNADLPDGVLETAPALVNLLVRFDPLITDHKTLTEAIEQLASETAAATDTTERRSHEIPVHYGSAAGPDLVTVAEATGLTESEVVEAHTATPLRVQMYGFAPGYAYLGDLPPTLRLPRKAEPVRDVPAGSVIIANNQCLITTLTMPTGWWIIGSTDAAILTPDSARPARFEPGDLVRFVNAEHGP